MVKKTRMIEHFIRKIMSESYDANPSDIIRQHDPSITAKKNAHAKSIRAVGVDWNDAFLRRVKSAKRALESLRSATKHDDWYLLNQTVQDEIDMVDEMKFGAEKYAKYLKQQWKDIDGIV